MIEFIPVLLVIFTGFSGIMINRNIVMKLISLDIMNTGMVCFFVLISKMSGSFPPIIHSLDEMNLDFVDPVPQAVIVTAIVIGFSTLSLSIALTAMVIEKTKKVKVDDIEKKVGT